MYTVGVCCKQNKKSKTNKGHAHWYPRVKKYCHKAEGPRPMTLNCSFGGKNSNSFPDRPAAIPRTGRTYCVPSFLRQGSNSWSWALLAARRLDSHRRERLLFPCFANSSVPRNRGKSKGNWQMMRENQQAGFYNQRGKKYHLF